MHDKITDYKILQFTLSGDLERAVKFNLKDGWELYGSLRGSLEDGFFQAMIKRSRTEELKPLDPFPVKPDYFRQANPQDQFMAILAGFRGVLDNVQTGVTPPHRCEHESNFLMNCLELLKPYLKPTWEGPEPVSTKPKPVSTKPVFIPTKDESIDTINAVDCPHCLALKGNLCTSLKKKSPDPYWSHQRRLYKFRKSDLYDPRSYKK